MPRRRQTLAAHLAPFAAKPKPAPVHHRTWIVEGLLRRGEITLLVGRPKDGKTCLAATLATAVARGGPFAGMPTEKTNVLYLAAEESRLEWNLGIGPYLSRVCPKRLAVSFVSFAIDHQPTLDALARKIEANAAGLVVVDPLLAALDTMDFDRFPAARNAILGLENLCRRTNVAALVVHHARERGERAAPLPRASGLLAVAARALTLNHRPFAEGRLITLTSDRPPLRLFSLTPGHYAPWPPAPHPTADSSTLPRSKKAEFFEK